MVYWGKRERKEKSEALGPGTLACLRGSQKAGVAGAGGTRGRGMGQGSGHVQLCSPLKGAWLPLRMNGSHQGVLS